MTIGTISIIIGVVLFFSSRIVKPSSESAGFTAGQACFLRGIHCQLPILTSSKVVGSSDDLLLLGHGTHGDGIQAIDCCLRCLVIAGTVDRVSSSALSHVVNGNSFATCSGGSYGGGTIRINGF